MKVNGPPKGSGRALLVLATIALLAPIAAGSFSRAVASSDDKPDSFYREFSVFTEVLEHIRKRYVEETSLESLFSGAFDGAVDALDPMATYVPAESVEAYRSALSQAFERSGLRLVRDRGFLFVVGVAPASPGHDAGLESGDILSKLNGRSTRLTPLWEAQMTLGGEPGAVVTAEVLRQGRMEEFEVTLGEFESAEAEAEMRDGVALIRIGRFEPGLVGRLETYLAGSEIAASGKLVLDLRNTAGGDAATALAAADLFVDGALGELRERSIVIESFTSSRPRIWDGQVVLITDRGSQGASEIFAAALQQGAGAAIVGGGTFGHAGRSSSRSLSTGGELFYTDAFYAAPDGTVLREPLVPDVRVTARVRRLVDAEKALEDLVLERAIEVAKEPEAAVKKAA